MENDEFSSRDRDLRASPRPPSSRRGGVRWVTGAIAAVTLVLFAVATWYAYVLGIRAGSGDQPPLIRADKKPEKARPEQPGGMNVPHQDKTVYDRVAPENGEKQVEQMLPPPEEPVARPKEPSAPPAAAAPGAPAETKAAETKTAEQKPGGKKPAEPKAAGPSAPAAPPSASGGYRVQLAALESEEAAAQTIARLKSANADLLRNVPLAVQRADLGEKGIYYRVQSAPLGDGAAAKALCDSLRSRNVGCLIVRP